MSKRKPVSIFIEPSIEFAASVIREGISKNHVLILIGSCSVEYKDRANSTLKLGERLVIIKEDGSILIHRPRGYSPVNWHPPGCLFEVQATKDKISIKAIHKKFKEIIIVFFKKMYTILILDIIDNGEFILYASEEDMRRAILAHPDILESGFHPISYEKKIEPGFVDVYGRDSLNKLVVVEIKRRTAGRTAVIQLAKYLEAIKGDASREVRGILAAPSMAKGIQQLLSTLNLEFKLLSPKKCAELLGEKRKGHSLDEYIP